MSNSSIKAKRDKKGRFKKASRLPSVAEAMAGKEFPQILRKIPAPHFAKAPRGKRLSFLASIHLWRWVFILLILSLLTLQIAQLGQRLYANYYEAQIKQAEKHAIEGEIAKWENIAKKRPNYRDAYFELAVLTYELNRISETKYYLSKVFALDPNFEPAKEFEKKMRIDK